jgi:hypothetical protein
MQFYCYIQWTFAACWCCYLLGNAQYRTNTNRSVTIYHDEYNNTIFRVIWLEWIRKKLKLTYRKQGRLPNFNSLKMVMLTTFSCCNHKSSDSKYDAKYWNSLLQKDQNVHLILNNRHFLSGNSPPVHTVISGKVRHYFPSAKLTDVILSFLTKKWQPVSTN